MEAYEVTALQRWGSSCGMVSCPGGLYPWSPRASPRAAAVGRDLGLQAQGIFVYQGTWAVGPFLAHPLLRFAQAWLLMFSKGLRALFWFKSFFVDELPPWLLEMGLTVPRA